VHGRPTFCLERHEERDELVGSPLCADCYDYTGAVLFNASIGELWRRVTVYARRHLGYLLGLSSRELDEHLRLSYVKIAELQRRGVVHLHAVVRADAPGDETAPPERAVTPALLADAFVRAVGAVSLRRELGGRTYVLSFGEQIRTEPLAGTDMARHSGYLAKYLVKEASGNGSLDHRLKEGEVELLEVSDHLRLMVETAFRLGRESGDDKLGHWAHALGFPGHLMTKSRRYSTTFLALRALRQAWRIAEREEPEEETDDVGWIFVGVGHTKAIDALLARTYWQGRLHSRAEYWADRHEKDRGP
jgi:hypothetical protein